MVLKKKLFISVIGGSKATPHIYKMAEKVGQLLAQNGAVVFCGGGTGVMEAVCKGAKSCGGVTVGILPGSKRSKANKFIDIPIPTGVGYARNKYVVKSGQAVIAIGGSYGTLTEIGYTLCYKIPLIGLETWKMVKEDHKKIPVHYVKTAQEAVALAIRLAKP